MGKEQNDKLMKPSETVPEWLKRLDGEKRVKELKRQKIAPEIYNLPAELSRRERGGVDVNEVLAGALKDGGVADKVYGQLFDGQKPEIAGQRLARVISSGRDKNRLSVIVEALLLGMGDASKPVVREVCPRGKRERRLDPQATPSVDKFASGDRSMVADGVMARLEPELKVKLVDHPIGDLIYVLQAPVRDRIRRMVREQGSNF
ncbi:hypothetical protein COX04_00085 [Candidatus Woesebacteria bacterium CG22_combo_CG10-13_8_21_14_all_45_10]|uniref:Uncharacterized protein n=1 Tax=Candidatus Woesebacteria bacterium CG22_combo_CG10-13_8_21_14_all_45_10 TaxID=1975060 RepID=A0A2H0BI84_9BACT|nr:MAG: hypothetical protein COX04_00085 [Candidatus Woesebacteria bacterium CG22_combo_CG10-13_8_21_14_all_45_10]